jgi:hypothetical protein
MEESLDDELFVEYLKKEGYFSLCNIKGKGICGIGKFAFTYGLVVSMDTTGYKERYCYPDLKTALLALYNWVLQGYVLEKDPNDSDWIKKKGQKEEYFNPLKI